MIRFLIDTGTLDVGIGRYLEGRARALRGRVQPVTYHTVLGAPAVPGGTWIFAALDCLSPAERELASALRVALVAQGQRVLNDPATSLLRHDLIDALYRAGTNSFRAVRASEYRGGLRFPVFLRTDRGHYGNMSPLLYNERELRQALLSARIRFVDAHDLLVVEFRDLSQNGWFHKYSAFRVGDRILSRHAQWSRHWMIKSETGDRSPDTARRERAYMEGSPHDAQLMPIFRLANIEYGRMDYAVHDGRVEVWEINTAPALGSTRTTPRDPDDPYRAVTEPAVLAHHERMCHAFSALDDSPPAGDLVVPWPQPALARRPREVAAAKRAQRVRALIASVGGVHGLGTIALGVERMLRSTVQGKRP